MNIKQFQMSPLSKMAVNSAYFFDMLSYYSPSKEVKIPFTLHKMVTLNLNLKRIRFDKLNFVANLNFILLNKEKNI